MTDNTPQKRFDRWQDYFRMQIAACDEKIAAGRGVEEWTRKRAEMKANLQ